MTADTAVPIPFATSIPLSAALRAEIVTDFDELSSLDTEWAQLWNDSPSATIFQSLSWQRAWWKAFGGEVQLCTPVIWKGDEVVGVLPLVRDHTAIRFLGTPGTDYCDVLCREEFAQMVLTTAFQSLLKMRGWRTCRLDNLRDDSQLFRHRGSLPASIQGRIHILSETHRSSLLLNVCRNEVISAVRRKPALKRHRNKLLRSGNVTFRHVEERSEAYVFLTTLFQQHVERRAVLAQHSQFLSSAWRTFYSALINEFDPKEQLRFSILELDGCPIACHFGFECRGSLTLYKPTFNIAFASLSPGDVLLDQLLAYAGERELKEVDFTIGRESYKQHFTNHTSEMFVMILDRGKFFSKVRDLFHPLSRRLEASSSVKMMKRIILRSQHSLNILQNKASGISAFRP